RMDPIEISGELSAMASAILWLCMVLEDCERGYRDVLKSPDLAVKIEECIDSLHGLSRRLQDFTDSRAAAHDWTNSDDLRRLRHVAQDLNESAERLSYLHNAFEFLSSPDAMASERPAFVLGARSGMISAVSFARLDLLVLRRRLLALSNFYAAPDVAIDDE